MIGSGCVYAVENIAVICIVKFVVLWTGTCCVAKRVVVVCSFFELIDRPSHARIVFAHGSGLTSLWFPNFSACLPGLIVIVFLPCLKVKST